MLNDFDVREVIEFESPDNPVLSIYLNVDPHRRSPEKYKLALRNLLDRAEGKADPEDIRRVYNYIEMGYNWHGRGVAMFSCAAQDFWWARSFMPPVEDSVMVSFRPYVRQLAQLMDIYERYGVIHIDQSGARLYVFHMGHLEAVEGYLGEEVRTQQKGGGWAAARYQRHEAEQARQNLDVAAETAESFYRRTNTRHLILAGTEKNVARFSELLSHRLRRMVVGRIAVDANASPSEVSEKALDLARKAAAEEAQATVNSVITTAHKGGNAILGLAETLTAVQNGRAQHVVALSDFKQPAYRFVESGYILLDLSEKSDLQSGRIQELPDAVDSVLRRAMAQGIGVTILDEHVNLRENGSIGALTRY